MRTCLLMLAMLPLGACVSEPGPQPIMTVQVSVAPSADMRYLVYGRINNFGIADNVRVDVTLGIDGTSDVRQERLGPLTDDWFMYLTDALEPDTTYRVRVHVYGDSGYDPRAEERFKTKSPQ